MDPQTVEMLNGWPKTLYLPLTFIACVVSAYWLMLRPNALTMKQRALFMLTSVIVLYIFFFVDAANGYVFSGWLSNCQQLRKITIIEHTVWALIFTLLVGLFWVVVRFFYRKLSWPTIINLCVFIETGFIIMVIPMVFLTINFWYDQKFTGG